ncbi:hypothetical protein [Lysobacter sp. A3-1-A15]|uniref:hypothetical protein n=1 Tax=Novilysobacter viscosus TaxID=3098602 RepID=UPI002EDACF46
MPAPCTIVTKSLAVLAAAFALGACTPAPTEPPAMPFAVPGAELTVIAADAACGPTGAYVADVAWRVDPAVAPKLEIQVGRDERKVFARSNEAGGTERTGEWVSSGMRFYLLDRESSRLLAAVDAGPGRCERATSVAPATPAETPSAQVDAASGDGALQPADAD